MRRRFLPFLLFVFGYGICLASPSLYAPYKEETARKVFDQLVLARGDFSLPKPQFQFIEHSKEVARFQGKTIFLGVKAYDVCTSFGPDSLNALSILLAHELIHYYGGHTWEEDFSRDFAGTELPEDVKDSWLEDEVHADLSGALLAYTAGFEVREIAPEFFSRIYQAFDRHESLAGYQSLSDRVLLANQMGEKVQSLLDYYETANYLVALGMYEDAEVYYQTILHEGYRSRELYNNLGVYKVMEALQLFRKSEFPYGLPVELDAESRIRRSTKGGDPDSPKEKREKLLNEANEYFETARNLDPKYTPALINQACVQAMLGVSIAREDAEEADLQYMQALILAKKANRESGKNASNISDIQVLRGLLAVLEDDKDEARSWWEKSDSPLAKTNLHILENGAFSTIGERLPSSNEREQIEDFSLDLFIRRPNLEAPMAKLESSGQAIQWGTSRTKSNLEQSSIFLHLIGPTHFAALQVTDPDYQGQTLLGVRIGDDRQKVLDTYKTPDTVVQLARGEFLVYAARNILFELDDQKKVVGWSVFRVKK